MVELKISRIDMGELWTASLDMLAEYIHSYMEWGLPSTEEHIAKLSSIILKVGTENVQNFTYSELREIKDRIGMSIKPHLTDTSDIQKWQELYDKLEVEISVRNEKHLEQFRKDIEC